TAPEVKIKNYEKPILKLGKGVVPPASKFVEIALFNFLKKYPQKTGVAIITKSQFSAKFGFGSSSASTVCTIYALSKLFKVKLSQKDIFDLSYKTVLDVQGKGSGFDVAAAIYGGTIYFKTGGQTIQSLKVKSIPLTVAYSGIKADTVSVLNAVSEKSKNYPKIVDNIYNNMELIVDRAKTTIQIADWEMLGELMDINQGYLESLGVSSNKLSAMIYAAREKGAYGAKLSGAGVGDCIIALVKKSKRQGIENSIKKTGGTIIKVNTNAQGVKTE
ncbi:mevalonate kinase, partial [Candidatus Curtissbacteria bacterium]|nr:mevalonate kinase [Candidatus Curtissbacteria bacterium]